MSICPATVETQCERFRFRFFVRGIFPVVATRDQALSCLVSLPRLSHQGYYHSVIGRNRQLQDMLDSGGRLPNRYQLDTTPFSTFGYHNKSITVVHHVHMVCTATKRLGESDS